MLSVSVSIEYFVTPHQDTLYQINYCHPPSSVPFFVHSYVPPLPIRRPYFISSIDLRSVQSFSPIIALIRADYVLLSDSIYIDIFSLPIRIPYIRSIIVTPHHQCLNLFIPLPQHIIRPYSYSFSGLISVELSLPIIPHQQSRIHFLIRVYIY